MSGPREVTIDVETGIVEEWKTEVGNPHERPLPPVLLFVASDIALALRQGTTTWPSRDTLTVTESGYATVTASGDTYVYELHPARCNDHMPYEPPVYVGRWPD